MQTPWRAIVIGVAFGLAAGCATPGPEAGLSGAGGTPTIQPTTIIPESFNQSLGGALPAAESVVVPKNMLSTSVVARPRAEVRAGPGAQFELLDMVLPKGAPVLLFTRVGVWQKVIIPKTWEKGWVHHQALAEPALNRDRMTVTVRELPTVLALHPIQKAYSFPGMQPIPVAVPRGAMFRMLMHSGWGTLVWLAETNSVMWVSKKDVR
jgi:hypothetical protein